MNRDDLIEAVKRAAFEHELDDMVHEVFSDKASAVNNGGVECQFDFLLENGWTLEKIHAHLRDIEVTNGVLYGGSRLSGS